MSFRLNISVPLCLWLRPYAVRLLQEEGGGAAGTERGHRRRTAAERSAAERRRSPKPRRGPRRRSTQVHLDEDAGVLGEAGEQTSRRCDIELLKT